MKQMMSSVGDIKVSASIVKIMLALRESLDKHIVEYNEALEIYKSKYLEAAKKALKDAKDGKFEGPLSGFGLQRPVDASSSYEDLIRSFSFVTTETIELELNQLHTIMNDSWDFAVAAKFVNSSYAVGSSF